MKAIMAIANKYPQVKIPQVKSHSPSDAPDVAPTGLAMLTLNDTGIIQTCCKTVEQMFGYRQEELGGYHVSTLLPHLGDTELVLEGRINSLLAFLCHCATPFKARRRDGVFFSSELFINRLGSQNVVVLVRSLRSEEMENDISTTIAIGNLAESLILLRQKESREANDWTAPVTPLDG